MRELDADHLVPLVERVHDRLRPGKLLRPPPRITFYAYVDAKSVVREREGRLHLRLSDRMAGAPDAVIEGVAGILLARYFRLPDSRADAAAVRAYRQFLHDLERSTVAATAGRPGTPSTQGAATAATAATSAPVATAAGLPGPPARLSLFPPSGRRKHIDPIGRHRSLLESYLRVTLDMDLALPQVPRLSWSKTVAGHRFGHWDPAHNVIVLSQILDDPDVPEFVLDYVLYHELLHVLHPVRMGSGTKRIIHSAAFRRDERRFPRWKEGEEWIGRLARRAKRRGRG